MNPAETVADVLQAGAEDAPALLAPGRPPLTHGGLRAHAARVAAALAGFGIGRDARVAIVLPNGPEMASAFATIAGAAATAPLNPAYRAEEFDFYLSDLKPAALIVPRGEDGAAVQVARRHGIPVLALAAEPEMPAGIFTLAPGSAADSALLRGRGTAAAGRPGGRGRTTWRWCCTPPAPPRAPRSCRSASATSPPPPAISSTRCA